MNTLAETHVRLLASAGSWIESEALRQFYEVAKLEGVQLALGFPNLHPGRNGPVGAAFVTEGLIYPSLIGGDIGCGMGLFKTDLLQRDIDMDRWRELRFDLEHPWEGNIGDELAAEGLGSSEFDPALGTIGEGGHFAELQRVEQVFDSRAFKTLGLGKQQLAVLVHSGSRGLGEFALAAFVNEHQGGGADPESFAAAAYLRRHDVALRWARVNLALIARRFAKALGAEAELILHGCHNSIAARESEGGTVWIHRKGAVEVNGSPVVMAGSSGSLSYLVQPTGDGESHAWSLAHGAGRRWPHSKARSRMRERFSVNELVQTRLGSRVICENRDVLYAEAPEAYKDIETVICDLVDAGLVSVIATFRPILTYKTRKQASW